MAIVGVVVVGGAVAISGLQVSLVMAAALSLGFAALTAVSFIRATPEERDRQRVLAWILIVAAVMAGSLATTALALGLGNPQ